MTAEDRCFDETVITVKALIEALEAIEDKTLPVHLNIASYGTDHFWITILGDSVILGVT